MADTKITGTLFQSMVTEGEAGLIEPFLLLRRSEN